MPALTPQIKEYCLRKLNKTKLRSAGCHLHVGYLNNNIETSLKMLRYVDAIVGLPSILFDTDGERRKLYGKAGCFRLTDYGKIK